MIIEGFDSYNLCLTGDIGRTLATPSGGLNEHIPVVIGCDMYNFNITGDVACCVNASSCDSPGHSGPSVLIALGCDMYNQEITGEVSTTLGVNCGLSTGRNGMLILNDQGGNVMNVSDDVAACLRAQDHGHPPVICLNFQGSKSNNAVTEDGTSYSLNAMHGHDVHVVCFDQDSASENPVGIKCFRKSIKTGHGCGDKWVEDDVTNTLNTFEFSSDVRTPQVVCFEPGILRRDCSAGNRAYINLCSTLRAQMGDNQPAVCYETSI